jgi:hypothetical protein
MRLYLKKPITKKRAGGVAQGIGLSSNSKIFFKVKKYLGLETELSGRALA